MNELLLVVIGSRGRLRSTLLEDLVAELDKVVFVEPVRIGAADRLECVVNERLSEVICGKRLSDSELGCAIAHRNARVAAENALVGNESIEWSLFVEDDADLDLRTFNQIFSELDQLKVKGPVIANYDYRNQSPFFRSKARKQLSVLGASRHLLPGAACYSLNREGIRHLNQFSHIPIDCVADWPLYFTRLKLFVSNQTWVNETTGPSTIGERSNQNVRSRFAMHVRQVANIRELSHLNLVPIRGVIQHLVITPLIRDILGRIWMHRSNSFELSEGQRRS